MSNAETYAKKLDSSCWVGKDGNVTRYYWLDMQPTFFHTGGTYKARWFDQIVREQEVLYAFRENTLVLESVFGHTRYRANYSGEAKITWNSDKGDYMVWESTTCYNAASIDQSQGYISYP